MSSTANPLNALLSPSMAGSSRRRLPLQTVPGGQTHRRSTVSPVAYDEELAERVRAQLDDEPGLTERKMFGGIAWMLEGNMAVGLISTGLLVRLGPEVE